MTAQIPFATFLFSSNSFVPSSSSSFGFWILLFAVQRISLSSSLLPSTAWLSACPAMHLLFCFLFLLFSLPHSIHFWSTVWLSPADGRNQKLHEKKEWTGFTDQLRISDWSGKKGWIHRKKREERESISRFSHTSAPCDSTVCCYVRRTERTWTVEMSIWSARPFVSFFLSSFSHTSMFVPFTCSLPQCNPITWWHVSLSVYVSVEGKESENRAKGSRVSCTHTHTQTHRLCNMVRTLDWLLWLPVAFCEWL